MKPCGDSIVAMCPLFPTEDGGSIPTSPLQLRFEIVNNQTAAWAFRQWHYLGDTGFLSSINFGAYFEGRLEGAVSYGALSAPELKGYWTRETQFGWYEIKRLALSPNCPRNSESRFIARTIALLRKRCIVKGIVTYADTEQNHTGIIYKASGFDYLGLTAPKNDYWVGDQVWQRGKTRNIGGEWLPRSRKHLFIKLFNEKKSLYPQFRSQRVLNEKS